jgi:superoxide dismutase, Fe-Mn family
MTFSLPELPYAYEALQPYMSRETLEYHHDKHHLAYVNNGNNLLKGTEWEGKSLEEIVKGSYGKNAGLFNNAGQHYNHLHFWNWMKPNGGGSIPGELEKAIVASLGSVDKMKEEFIAAGTTQFGSGWAWLVDAGSGLEIMKTANADLPMKHNAKALVTIDVWEHAYYIDYRNVRPKYIETYLDSLINWDFVNANL